MPNKFLFSIMKLRRPIYKTIGCPNEALSYFHKDDIKRNRAILWKQFVPRLNLTIWLNCQTSLTKIWVLNHFDASRIGNCPFHILVQTHFRRYYFLLLVRSSSNSPRSLEGFRRTLVPNFIQIRQRVTNFSIDPHCKNCPLSATLLRAIFTVGAYGEILQQFSNPVEISPQSLSKTLKWPRRN